MDKMASSSDNLLIDLDASNGTNSTAETNASPKPTGEPVTAVTDSVSLFRSAEPLYKLLGSNATSSIDSADNNPFDCMVKQAGLLDDPFEIVENAAKANPTSNAEHQHLVKTGTLISLDSLDVPTPPPEPYRDEIIEISSSSDSSHHESISARQTPNSVQNGNATNDERTPSPASSTHGAFASMNMSTPVGRTSAKTKSSALHLLKFSLSNNRMDSTSDNGSPIPIDQDSSSGDEYATILHQKMLSSKTLMLRTPQPDESFDDLSATKPNWVDSETDMENDSDLDNDIAKLNIPMLTTKVASEGNTLVAIDTPSAGDRKKTDCDVKSKEHEAILNRDKLLEKLASIKLRHPSPTDEDRINGSHGDEDSDQVDDENRTLKNESARSAISTSLRLQNAHSLMENLRKLVDQCDDKQKQLEAKTLLQSLSSILTLDGESTQVASAKSSSSSFELTPPYPIVRQGTFNIDRDKNDREKRETSPKQETTLTPKTSPKSKSPSGCSTLNPALSQVLKDLQSVLGTNRSVNVVQTNIQPQTTDGTNPTYIVVCASSKDTVEMGTPQSNNTAQRSYRSQSFSSRDRPVAAVRAAQVKAEQPRPLQTASACQTPMRRPPLIRRSSFGAITRTKTTEPVVPPPKPSTTILRRRSLQGPMPSSSLRPPSPKTTFTAKSTTAFNLSAPSSDAVPAKRRSLLSSTAAAPKDSPSKMKSSYGILKKPQAPPLVRNLKIRVKESFAGRSSAPMRAVVPMNRVAPLVMINESVSPLEDKRRKGAITSTPRSLGLPGRNTGGNTSIRGNPLKLRFAFNYAESIAIDFPFTDMSEGCLASSSMTPVRPLRRDTSFASVTPKPMLMRDVSSKPAAPTLTRRRSLSDYRGPAPVTAPPTNSVLKSANKMGSGLLGTALGKYAQSKLVNSMRHSIGFRMKSKF